MYCSFTQNLILSTLVNKGFNVVKLYVTSADLRASLIIISSPPYKPPTREPLLLDAGFLADSVSDTSDSSVSESSPSLITTGSCLGGATNDTYMHEETQGLNIGHGKLQDFSKPLVRIQILLKNNYYEETTCSLKALQN